MSNLNSVPNLQDMVSHKLNDMSGVVIAKFAGLKFNPPKPGIFLDVRGDNNRVYYNTPAENWTVIATREELEKGL